MSATPSESWGYRPGLDGLRTVAIYLVVLFHAGLVHFGNGYIGVDVFFVLSGYLVTNVMLGEHRETGGLRLGRFYARRIRRLLPAAVVLVTTVCAATILVLPRLTRVTFVSDARSSLLYVANWHFLGAATDYFAADVDRSPFLHFWSLAIEEQFYVVYPLLLLGLMAVAARRRRASIVPLALLALVAASLVAQVVTAGSSTLRAYYGTHTRLYQLLAGGVLAAGWSWTARTRAALTRTVGGGATGAGIAAAVGTVALVLLSTDALEMSVSNRGILAMSVAVVVVAAIETAPTSITARFLSRPTMTYLGKISYGTYLWHWPIIVLTRVVLDLSPLQMAIVAGVGATAMSALSFQVLETPIRRTKLLASWPRAVVAIGLSCSVLVAFTAAPGLLRSERRPALARSADASPVDAPTDADLAAALAVVPPADFDLAATEPPAFDDGACGTADPATCVVHRGTGMRVHLIGDSNAIVLVPLLLQLAVEHDFTLSVSARVGCPWQDGLTWVASDDTLVRSCVEARADWYDTIIPALDPDVIIAVHVPRDTAARADGSVFTPAAGNADGRSIEQIVADATDASIDRLTAGDARVILMEPLPYTTVDPTACMSGAATVGECAWQANAEPYPTELAYRAEAEARDDVFDVDPDALACPYLPVCVPYLDGQLVFRNQFHVSNAWFLDHADAWWTLLDDSGAFTP